MSQKNKHLIIITGPTGSGKTDLALEVAQHYGCNIISADSRQIYRGLTIGTAAPTDEQLATVPHHFVQVLDLDQPYSAAQFEADVMDLLPRLFARNPVQVMCGGSMMYVDAVVNGIDDLPTISAEVRAHVLALYNGGGLRAVRERLGELDPVSLGKVDPMNPRRNIHALEICLQAGCPASQLLTGQKKERPFSVSKFYIDLPREVLFDRINRRVDAMVERGLVEEARSVYHLRHLNSLNTVGYKEMFAYLDGEMDLPTAIARMAKNTRVYAKKQLTWLKRDPAAIPITDKDTIIRIKP